jgi:hypothetical protein
MFRGFVAFRQQEGRAQLAENMAHHHQHLPEGTGRIEDDSPSRQAQHQPEALRALPDAQSRLLDDPRRYATPPTKDGGRQKKPVSSFQIFFESASIYLACLILPSVVGSLYKQWLIHLQESSSHMTSSGSESNISPTTSETDNLASSHASGYYASTATLAWSYYDSYVKPYACSVDPTEYSPTLGSYYTYYLGCHHSGEDSSFAQSVFLFSPDTTPYQDIQFVLLLSIGMALVRSGIVACTLMSRMSHSFLASKSLSLLPSSSSAPRFSPSSIPETTVQAMIRCKSIGLLSPDYYYGGISLTPTNSVRLFLHEHEEAPHPPRMSTMDDSEEPVGTRDRFTIEDRDVSHSHLGLGIDDLSNHLEDAVDANEPRDGWFPSSTIAADRTRAGAAAVGGGRASPRPHDIAESPSLATPARATVSTVQGMETLADDREDALASLYAGPRFATALFRLGYSVVASTLAYVWFHRASFWPWYVGGSGTTKACWDLSGGLTLGMDSDFDSRNLVLKRYFLLQASYHSQSIAFHILSLVMLIWDFHHQHRQHANLFVDDGGRRRSFWSVAQKTTRSYARALLQHLLALLLIAVAYIFSSLRRLGAIGMFALDISSCFMHLLQIALNKKSSDLSSRWIPWLYYGGVFPSFVGMRLCVWPRLWYSATFESHSWFDQLERTLFPNSALVVQATLHVWMVLVMYLTAVNLKRLWWHPHLQRRLRR